MAFKHNLVNRMFNICNNNFSNQTLRNCRISRSSSAITADHFPMPPSPNRVAPDPGDDNQTLLRRFLVPDILRSRNQTMLEKLKEINITRDRIRLDGLSPLPAHPESSQDELTLAYAKKILRISQIENMKTKLKSHTKNCISYDEFIEICVGECPSIDQAMDLAKALDDSGSVIVLGNVVFLKPQQVMKAIHGLMPNNLPATHNAPLKELEEMEQWKSTIDAKAKKMVQRELWGGLAYLMVQTAGFMRLTFWELSWDVMEPICFYVTSMYFMGGYAFFLRTAKEPSFEGFFQSRFSSKQKKLMKREGFDVEKYKELRKACYPHEEAWPRENGLVDDIAKKSFT
uniref:calcium uniporter protein 2, mitochondrial-like n=1 Tax=Erigeron canadensis TaxID=72917 RepID=UPI001CB90693|nr:calcium uniporter protein 2, mitochondrial-like [Erigeron canadensis]